MLKGQDNWAWLQSNDIFGFDISIYIYFRCRICATHFSRLSMHKKDFTDMAKKDGMLLRDKEENTKRINRHHTESK